MTSIIYDRSQPKVPMHPGEILRAEFMEPLDLTANSLAKALGVSAPTVNDIAPEHRGISADMALRLGKFFNTSPELWLNLQKAFELDNARKAIGDRLDNVVAFSETTIRAAGGKFTTRKPMRKAAHPKPARGRGRRR